MARPFRQLLCLMLACTTFTSGCRVWSTTTTTPVQYFQSHRPNQVRIFRHNGTRVVLLEPEIVGDSLRGYAETTGRPTIAIGEIDSIAVRRTSWGRTVGLVGIVGAVVVVTTLLSSCDETRSIC